MRDIPAGPKKNAKKQKQIWKTINEEMVVEEKFEIIE